MLMNSDSKLSIISTIIVLDARSNKAKLTAVTDSTNGFFYRSLMLNRKSITLINADV